MTIGRIARATCHFWKISKKVYKYISPIYKKEQCHRAHIFFVRDKYKIKTLGLYFSLKNIGSFFF